MYAAARSSVSVCGMLTRWQAEVIFGVDATCLHTYEKLRKRSFHRIVFNFPHTGAGSAEGNVEQNQVRVQMSTVLPCVFVISSFLW